jgi:hypothetical protein
MKIPESMLYSCYQSVAMQSEDSFSLGAFPLILIIAM